VVVKLWVQVSDDGTLYRQLWKPAPIQICFNVFYGEVSVGRPALDNFEVHKMNSLSF
jgi:hypothetical protein